MNCETVEELAGAYAVDALSADTLREVEKHLESCSRHSQLAGLRGAAVGLSGAVAQVEPPPALKTRILAAVKEESQEADAHAAPGESWLRRLLTPRLAPYAVAAALAIVSAGLLGWNLYLQTAGESDEGVLVSTISDSAVEGRVVYVPEERLALLDLRGLDPLSDDKTYQVWAISGGEAEGIGFLDVVESGEAVTLAQATLSEGDAVAVTVEPAGGSPQPTSNPIFLTEL